MGIRVRNNTDRVIGYGGARIAPHDSAVVDRTRAVAIKHPFFKEGWLSVGPGGSAKKVEPQGDDSGGDTGGDSGDDGGGGDE